MPALTIRLFGTFEALLQGQPVEGLHLREGERLLAYLTLKSGVEISYRELAERFWPAEARMTAGLSGDFQNTRQAIRKLRVALGDQAFRLGGAGKSLVTFDLTGAEVDVRRYETLAESDAPSDWREAARLYRAPLLEGWSETWAAEARERKKRSYTRLLRKLIAAAREARADTEEAEWLSCLARAEPGEEAHTRERMAVLLRQGRLLRREEVYGELQERLALTGGQPSPETTELLHLPHAALPELHPLEPAGGAVVLESRFYVIRASDELFAKAIRRQDSIVLVKGARQMGKTSLLARGLQQARAGDNRVVLTDFQSLTERNLESLDSLFLSIATSIAHQLDIERLPRETWDPDFGASMNLELYLRRQVLNASPNPLVWGMDEVDRLFHYPFAAEVFGLFRSWHNRRALDPAGPWSRLTLAIAYATEAHLFITDPNQSPFNVGTRIVLDDFSREETADLNTRYGAPLGSAADVARLYDLLNGQPYLTRCAFDELAQGRPLTDLEANAAGDNGPFQDHLRRLLASLTRVAALADALRAILQGRPCPDAETFYRLRSAGVVAGEWGGSIRLRCRLYAAYLARHLA